MRLVMFYTHNFSYKTAKKSLDDVPEVDRQEEMADAVVIFFHVEEEDQEKKSGVIKKFVKNAKWLCGKFKTRNVVLHSFNHLSISKAPPDFSQEVLLEVIERLKRVDYKVMTTPFGYFNEFNMHVAGDSLAKVYKEF